MVTCAVFNDFSGHHDLTVRYKLSDLRTKVVPWSLAAFYEEISGFDGRHIYLLGSRVMTLCDDCSGYSVHDTDFTK